MRAAVYARLSEEKDASEEGVNITDQQETGKAFVEKRGWKLIEGPSNSTFTDDGKSAYTKSKSTRRVEWEAMLATRPDVIVVRDAARLSRNQDDDTALIHCGARYVAWLGDTGDVDWDAGVRKFDSYQFAVEAAANRENSRQNGAKVANKVRVKAAKGAWPHGGTRPFGYHHPPKCCGAGADGCGPGVIIEEEAAVILETAGRWLAGESLSALCRDLTARGITTPKGNPWQYARLRAMLSGPRVAGIRTHKGVESRGPSSWPAIVDADLHRRLKTAASESMMRRANENGTYLLTSIVWCGTCEKKMYGLTQRMASGSRVRYVCRGEDGCGAGIAGPQTDEFVANRSFMSILAPELRDQEQSRRDLATVQAHLADLRSRVEELDAAYWKERSLDKARWLSLSASLTAAVYDAESQETEIKQRLTRLRDAPTTAEALAVRWRDADTRERNRLLRVGVEHVVIHARRPGKAAFDPGRIEVHFNDGRVEGFLSGSEPTPV